MKIKNRLLMLVLGGVSGLLLVAATLSVVLNELRVGGQTYQQIINDKDLLADILPPPVYVIESYLTVYQILENLDPKARDQLWKRIDKLKEEFQARKQFWLTQTLPRDMTTSLADAVRAAETFFVVVEKLKHTELYSVEQTEAIAQMHKAYAEHRQHIDHLVTLSNDHFNMVSVQADTQLGQSIWFVAVLVLLIILMAAYMGVMTLKRVTEPVDKLVMFMQEIIRTGNLGMRCKLDGSDEITTIARAFDQTLTTFQTAIAEVNRVMGAIGQGRFDERVTASLYGDLGVMRDGVNASAENVAFMMQQLAIIMSALDKGDFTVRMDARVAQDFRQQVDGAMGKLQSVVTDINMVMAQVAKGELNVHVSVQAQGALAQLKDNVNTTVSSLASILGDVTQTVNAQAEGDLTARVRSEASGSFNALKTSVNQSAAQMEQAVSAAMSAAHSVSQASSEVAQGSLDLSQRTQSQAASLEETAAAMEQTLASVNRTRSGIADASKISTDQQMRNLDSQKIMTQTVAAMQGITHSSEQIGNIVSLIDSIAFQTNLLALNAAVEAARAGEHGRGFAVVAGEVRALAGKSADAAKEIKQLIDNSVSQVREGSSLIGQVSAALETISAGTTQMQQTIEDISRAAHEQVKAIEQVNSALGSIDRATQQNAALVEETSAAASGMQMQADDLAKLMVRFKVSTGHRSEVLQLGYVKEK